MWITIIIIIIIIIIITIIIIIIFIRNDGCHYVGQRAQTATLHYTRGPAESTLKQDTGMPTHLPLRDSGTRRPETLSAQDIDVSTNSRLVSWA